MELQIKTMLRLHFTPFRMAKINKMTIDASKDMDSFLTNSHSLLAGLQPGAATTDISMENYIKANLKIHLPSEPATPFGIYKEDLISYDRDPCSATLMAFFFTARKWKQHKDSSTDEWREKTWSICPMDSTQWERKMQSSRACMETETVTLSDMTQTQRTSDPCSLSYMDPSSRS